MDSNLIAFTNNTASDADDVTANFNALEARTSLEYDLTDGATIAVDWANGNQQRVVVAGSRTFTFANPREGTRYTILHKQDATGSRVPVWPGGILWKGGAAPTPTATANKTDIYTFFYSGGVYYGMADLNF